MNEFIACLLARVAAGILHLCGRRGTALPGRIAEMLHSKYLIDLLNQIPLGVLLVTGTNGKTTTSHLLAAIIAGSGIQVIHNASGSNLTRGILSSILPHCNWRGKLAATSRAIGVFEVDEAVLAQLLPSMTPRTLVLTNLFRDQLDRYGELDSIARSWSRILSQTEGTTRLVFNADDPSLAFVASDYSGEKISFGVANHDFFDTEPDQWSDSSLCPRCSNRLQYRYCSYSHLGDFVCKGCGFSRPELSYVGVVNEIRGLKSSRFNMALEQELVEVNLPLPGLFNIYNGVAASCAAYTSGLGIDPKRIPEILSNTSSVFGRGETFRSNGKVMTLLLIKNPTGANEVIRALAGLGNPIDVMILLNDGVADGQDVSWVWDVEFSMLELRSITISGRRYADMALRLKYAECNADEFHYAHPTVANALDNALSATEEHLYVLATYTAMLEVRQELVSRGIAEEYRK